MDRFTDDEKLGLGFTSVNDLIEVDIGSGDRPRPTFISAKLDSECKRQLTDLLKEFKDFRLEHIPRLHNEDANRLAQHASGYQPILEVL